MKKLIIIVSFFICNMASAAVCFWADSIWDWQVTGRNKIQVRESARRAYDIELYTCTRLDWAERIAFRTFPRGSNRVCEGDDLLILDNFGRRIQEICTIRNITRVTEKSESSI